MMKILVLTNTFPSLSEKFLLNQMAALKAAGADLTVLSAVEPPSGTKEKEDEENGHRLYHTAGLDSVTVQLHIPRNRKKRFFRALAAAVPLLFSHPVLLLRGFNSRRYGTMAKNLKTVFLLRFLLAQQKRGVRWDLVHAHFGQNGLLGAWMKDCGFCRELVVTFHGADILAFPRKYGAGIYAYMYRRADAVTCGTRFVLRKLTENGCPEGKITVLPMGINPQEYTAPETGKVQTAEPMSGTEKPFTVLSVGRVLPLKGFAYAIRAVAPMEGVIYRIAGDGPQRGELEKLAAELGAADRIFLPGPKVDRELQAMYAEASVFLLPSIRAENGWEEAQGLVVQEAGAAGIPVIASDIGGVAEGILDGETGFLVPEKNPEAIREKLLLLQKDPGLRRKMGKNARAFVTAHYDCAALACKQLEIYARIAGHNHIHG